MIIEYHRPESLQAALNLLSRNNVVTVPLGGGSIINQHLVTPVAVVDLQDLKLDSIINQGKNFVLGASVTLQEILSDPDIYPALKTAIQQESTYNIRQVGTVAGGIVTATGRSPLATTLLALGADLRLLPGDEILELGDFLPLRKNYKPGYLISEFKFPNHLKLAYAYVARTPADLPIVCVAVAKWSSGRTRVALGGFGDSPILAMDGPQSQGAEIAARNAYQEAEDAWASAEYRREMAASLTRRCIDQLSE